MRHDPKSLGYMPTLDGVRGIACLIVFIQHIDSIYKLSLFPEGIGALGVQIFFALSGFLMGALYFAGNCGYDKATTYIVSRASRIAPAYYIAIVFCWILYLAIPEFPYEMTPLNLFRSFAFMGSEGVFWSIPPEVQFYGYFLFLWFAYAKSTEGNYFWLAFAVVLTLVLISTRSLWGGILLPSKLHVFLFGFLAALIFKKIVERNVKIPAWAQIVMVVSCIAYYSSFKTTPEMYDDVFFAVMVGFTIMCLSVETAFTYVLKTPFMRLMGAASFSIYLFHEAIFYVIVYLTDSLTVQLLLALPVALGLPLLFHFYVERPLNRHSKVWGIEWAARFKQRYLVKA